MGRPEGLPKTGGRKRGTPNLKSRHLMDSLAQAGLNVPERLVQLLPELEKERQASVLLELMAYLFPKRKSIEQQIEGEVAYKHSGRVDLNFSSMSEEELLRRSIKTHRAFANLSTDKNEVAAYRVLVEQDEKELAALRRNSAGSSD